eukprot:1229789-Prymnesium_polylepis.1
MAWSTSCLPPHPLQPHALGQCRGPASRQTRNVRNSPCNQATRKVLGGKVLGGAQNWTSLHPPLARAFWR